MLYTTDDLLTYTLAYTNRYNDVNHIVGLLEDSLPYIRAETIGKLKLSSIENDFILNPRNKFIYEGISQSSLKGVCYNIRKYMDECNNDLSEYITILGSTKPVTYTNKLSVKELHLLESIYYFMLAPIIIQKQLLSVLNIIWTSNYSEHPLRTLKVGKQFYNNSFYIREPYHYKRLLMKYKNADADRMSRIQKSNAIKSLAMWVNDKEFDTVYGIVSRAIMSYGNTINSYIETKSPSLSVILRIQGQEVIRTNRLLRMHYETRNQD